MAQRSKARVFVELEIETRENCDIAIEAPCIVNDVLDAGTLQEAIEETAAIVCKVTSALVVGSRAVEGNA